MTLSRPLLSALFRLPPMDEIAEVLRGIGLGTFDFLVSASIEHQRSRIAHSRRRQHLHFTYQDQVVASIVACMAFALQCHQCARYQQGTRLSHQRLELLPLVREGPGKSR